MKQLHSGAKWLFFLRGFFSAVFIFFFLIIFSLGAIIPLFADGILKFGAAWIITPIIFFVVVLFIAFIYSNLAYRFWKYEFTETQLRIERGIIWKIYSNIPYERIQNVDITRGILARILGFSSLNIQTAGYHMPSPAGGRGVGSEGYIPAVSKDEAEKLRIFLIKKISNKKTSGL